MHDPMTVAFEVKVPIPKRCRWREKRADGPRWTLGRRTFTGPESHVGKPIDPWWRPKAYSPRIAGRMYQWRRFITVWHIEPSNGDTTPPCGSPRWRWHLHHCRLQVHPWQHFRDRFVRCAECGRRMNTAQRFSYMSSDQVWHQECMALRHLRGAREDDEHLIRRLFDAYRVAADLDEAEALDSLRHLKNAPDRPHSGFRAQYRLQGLLGYKRDDARRLVKR